MNFSGRKYNNELFCFSSDAIMFDNTVAVTVHCCHHYITIKLLEYRWLCSKIVSQKTKHVSISLTMSCYRRMIWSQAFNHFKFHDYSLPLIDCLHRLRSSTAKWLLVPETMFRRKESSGRRKNVTPMIKCRLLRVSPREKDNFVQSRHTEWIHFSNLDCTPSNLH